MTYDPPRTADIAAVLRYEARWSDVAAGPQDETTRDYCDMCERAALTIERLRRQLEEHGLMPCA